MLIRFLQRHIFCFGVAELGFSFLFFFSVHKCDYFQSVYFEILLPAKYVRIFPFCVDIVIIGDRKKLLDTNEDTTAVLQVALFKL